MSTPRESYFPNFHLKAVIERRDIEALKSVAFYMDYDLKTNGNAPGSRSVTMITQYESNYAKRLLKFYTHNVPEYS